MRRLYPLIKAFFLVGLLVCCITRAACGQATAGKEHDLAGKRPNILLVISDDQSWPHASAYGYEGIPTPAFDRIAREGILFNQAFAASPSCSPSRAALLTGLNCWQLEEAGTHASSFPKKFITFPDLLEAAGYYIGASSRGWGPGDYEASGRKRNPAGPEFSDITMESPEGISSEDYASNFKSFLKGRQPGQPFFSWMGGRQPHRPYKKGIGKAHGMDPGKIVVPPFLPDVAAVRNDMLDYGYEIRWFDAHLERAIGILEEAGELDNTLIVVTSDNGMPFPRAKINLYEYGIHMPLAIRWGKEVKGGRWVDDLVCLTDLFATFLEVAGAAFPDYPVESKSLLNILSSEESGIIDSTRRAVYASRERHSSSRWNNLGYPQRCVRTHEYLYIRNFKPERWPAGAPRELDKNGNLKEAHGAYYDMDGAHYGNHQRDFIIRERNNPRYSKFFDWAVGKRPAEELYDIVNDPGCLVNLSGDPEHLAVLLKLRTRLGGYLMRTGDPRVTGNGEVFESYPRLRGEMRMFPKPEWAQAEQKNR